jgi:hypothetical protein
MVNILDKDMSREQYLVNFTYIEKQFIEYGFEKQEDMIMRDMFNDMSNVTMSDEELEFTTLFRIHVYKKTQQTPDKLGMNLTKRAARRTKR